MLVRRYLPVVGVVLVMLLAVVLAPSRPRQHPGPAVGGTFAAAPTTSPSPGTTAATGFCVVGLLEHPPCVPLAAPGPARATSPGVSATSVTVVMYRAATNRAVEDVLRASGGYVSPQVEQTTLAVVGAWINQHYQLYGRHIEWKFARGTCGAVTPQDACFRSDADRVVATYKPFAVFWDSDTNESAFFSQLSRKGVVNWGGWHFSDAFDTSLRPFHYDVFTGGDRQADLAGEYWCKRLAHHPARLAGPALRTRTRRAAVIYPATATTTPSAKRLEAIIEACDPGGVVDAPYSSDISTSAAQTTTGVSKAEQAGVTTDLWFSDPVAPIFGTRAQAAQGYYPEQILVGSGLLDSDTFGQRYDPSEWANAFGLSDLAASAPISESDAGIIWRAQGRTDQPDPSASLLVAYMTSLAGGVMAAGSDLTPATYERGLLRGPGYDSWAAFHDPRLVAITYGPGDYTAISDVREVYFDAQRASPANGNLGSYVALSGGRRYGPGEIPTGEPDIPVRR